MEENRKKRCRKSKLVLRDCMDSDDENIAVMQQEIEAALENMKNKSILKRLNRQPPAPKSPQFSVKVEVEEIDEPREAEENLNIKIGSVKSLSEPTAVPQTTKDPEVIYFRLSDEIIRTEFERVSRKTTSIADKRIELNVRNILGKKRINLDTNYVDVKIQKILRRSWKNWRNPFPAIRETPLLYKCYACSKAWWHLNAFREHVRTHKKNMMITFQTVCHECHLIAHDVKDIKDKVYSTESNCWRCNRDLSKHPMSNWDKTTKYRCNGCKEKFYTCTLLFEHENNCSLYIKFSGKSTLNEFYACTQCPARVISEKELHDHMIRRHSVRSDLPEDWVLKFCSQCDYPFHLQAVHDCPLKPYVASCRFCSQKFNSHTFVLIHLNSTQHSYPCKVCGLVLKKQCMELQHLMEHTNNYTKLYKCIYCLEGIYFSTLSSINKHKITAHPEQIESKSLGTCYDVVVVPKRLIQTGKKAKKNAKELSSHNDATIDHYYEGSADLMGKPYGSSTVSCTAVSDKINEDETKGKIIDEEGYPSKKRRVEKEKSTFVHDNIIIDITIPDSPQDIQVQEKDSNQDNTLENNIMIVKSENCQYNIINNIKAEPADVTVDYNQEHMSENVQEHENTTELSTITIKDILSNEINHYDPFLVVKEEIIDYNEITEAELEPEGMPNIKIENVMRIKEEPTDVIQENNNVANTDSSTISDTNNKTSITHRVNDKSRSNHNRNVKTKIHKKRAENNYKLNYDNLIPNFEKYNSNINNGNSGVEIYYENDNIHIETLGSSIDNDNVNNEKCDDASFINMGIKQEMDDDNFYTNYAVNVEDLTYEIKEENLDEIMEDDMIILDPNNSVNVNYENDPNPPTKTPAASDDGDSKEPEPELVVYHSHRKKMYKCTKCPYQGYHHAFKIHLKNADHFPNKKACLRKSKTVERTTKYTCSKCEITYPSWYKYIVHFSKVHDYKSQTCPKCFRPHQNMQSLQTHLNSHVKESFVNIYVITTKEQDESEQLAQQCKTCSEKVANDDQFEHWENHLEILDVAKKRKPWKGFTTPMEHKHELKKMLLLLQGINPSPDLQDKQHTHLRYCFKCKRRFERKNECKRHFIEHLLMDAYQERHKYGFLKCQICSTNFYTSERYKRHMRDHGSLPLYKCELCDKAFSDSSNFTKHKKVHNLDVMICDICNKKFTGKVFLEKHMMMHQKVKPLVCQECDKVFYTESSYRKHISRGKTRFKCPSCHIFFTTLRDKWDHMWEVHKERKFQADCPICYKSFRKHQDVRKHMRTEHKGSTYKYVPDKTPLTDIKHKKVADADDLVVVYMDE